MTIDRLRELYDDYISDLRIAAGQRNLSSAFGNLVLGAGRQDSCHIRFAEKVEKALAGFDFNTEDAEEVMDFVLCKGCEYRDHPSTALMMTAMQRFLVPFAGHVSREKAAAVLRWYDSVFDKRSRTPVMEQFRKALKKKAEGK